MNDFKKPDPIVQVFKEEEKKEEAIKVQINSAEAVMNEVHMVPAKVEDVLGPQRTLLDDLRSNFETETEKDETFGE